MSSSPKISVIVPVFNQEKFLTDCLESILHQSLKPFEIIICDDASSDSSQALILQYIEKYPDYIRGVLHKKNIGLASNFNSGLDQIRGDYFSFIAGDDLWHSEKLEREFNALSAGFDYAFSLVYEVDADGQLEPLRFSEEEKISGNLFVKEISRSLHARNALIKTRCIQERCVRFKDLFYGDWDFAIQISRFYQGVKVNAFTVVRRRHPKSLTDPYELKSQKEFYLKKVHEVVLENRVLISEAADPEKYFIIMKLISFYIDFLNLSWKHTWFWSALGKLFLICPAGAVKGFMMRLKGKLKKRLERLSLSLKTSAVWLLSLILPARIMRDKAYFSIWQKKGYHVTPVHFYEPIPDTEALGEYLWENKNQVTGVNFNESAQLQLLSEIEKCWKREYEKLPRNPSGNKESADFFLDNSAFTSVDAEMLYGFIRQFKPTKVIEVGSGFSTRLSAKAGLKNQEEGYEFQLVAIEPHPDAFLKRGFPGFSALITSPVQNVPLAKFKELKENDILFIDSSHVLKIGSDVQYEYLEILPVLQKGVIVHIHDIFMPAEYPKEWIFERSQFWTEQYLLQAFMAFNDSFEVLWAGSYMHLVYPEKLEGAFSSYDRNKRWPGSFWIRKIK